MKLNLKNVFIARQQLSAIRDRRFRALRDEALVAGGWRMGNQMAEEAVRKDSSLAHLWQAIVSAEVIDATLRGEADLRDWTVPHDAVLAETCKKYGIKI